MGDEGVILIVGWEELGMMEESIEGGKQSVSQRHRPS